MPHSAETTSGFEEATVFVVDDDEAVRESLSWLFASVGIKVETFASAQDFLDKFEHGKPGCLLVDVRMPGMNGLELQRKIAETPNCLPVIIITGHGDVQMAVRAMKDGAYDFIEKPFNDQVILDQVQRAVAECQNKQDAQTSYDRVELLIDTLTPREREVMDMVIEGETNKSIARKMNISDKTVEAHRAKVMDKLEATSLADLIRKALGSPLANKSG